MSASVLVIDPSYSGRMQTTAMLKDAGFLVESATGVRAVGNAVASFATVLTEAEVADGSWSDVLDVVCASAQVVILTDRGSLALAVTALKRGVRDVLAKPSSCDQLARAMLSSPPSSTTSIVLPPTMTLERALWEYIQRAILDNNGNITAAARSLGLHRQSLQRKLRKGPVVNI